MLHNTRIRDCPEIPGLGIHPETRGIAVAVVKRDWCVEVLEEQRHNYHKLEQVVRFCVFP